VSERDAAALLGKAANTLRNRRMADAPIPFRTFAGRVQYALADLTEYIAAQTEKSDF
jgi:hypothetical protein|tara:strand:- start:2150 stop:2320 length:171 start_codon:yes stop_codon:yes gene_type:complete